MLSKRCAELSELESKYQESQNANAKLELDLREVHQKQKQKTKELDGKNLALNDARQQNTELRQQNVSIYH